MRARRTHACLVYNGVNIGAGLSWNIVTVPPRREEGSIIQLVCELCQDDFSSWLFQKLIYEPQGYRARIISLI